MGESLGGLSRNEELGATGNAAKKIIMNGKRKGNSKKYTGLETSNRQNTAIALYGRENERWGSRYWRKNVVRRNNASNRVTVGVGIRDTNRMVLKRRVR